MPLRTESLRSRESICHRGILRETGHGKSNRRLCRLLHPLQNTVAYIATKHVAQLLS